VSPRAAVLGAAAVALVPAAAGAASEGSAAMDFVWKVLNLALLLGVLVFAARKPVLNFLAERRDTVRNQIETSEKLLRDAEGRVAEWNRRAAGLAGEVEALRDTARRAAEQEAASIVADAQASAQRIRAGASEAVEAELRRARTVLQREAADLAVELAARLLREQVTPADRDRLLDEFVEKVRRGGARA
jgi:F-type H+-transporting ATPase subunit b